MSCGSPASASRCRTSEDRLFTTLTNWGPAGTPGNFVISPNGRTLLYNRLANREEDLMLIEHFR